MNYSKYFNANLTNLILRSILLFILLGLFFIVQTTQAQVDSLSDAPSAKKEVRLQNKKGKKLLKAQKNQEKFLASLNQKDSTQITPKELKKLAASNKEIKQLEKELAIPKINKNKLLNDLSKDTNADPYLKEYAKYKKVKKPTSFESAVKTTNSELLKNKKLDKGLKDTQKIKGVKTDSASLVAKGKQYGLAELNRQGEVKALKKELKPYLGSPYLKGYTLKDLDSLNADSLKVIAKNTFNNLDKVLEKELSKRAEMVAFKADMAKMKEFKNLPENYKKQFDQYSDTEYLQKEGVSRAVKEASKYLAEHQTKLTAAQTKLSNLKKKYSSVPNSKDLSTATKRNSLKGKPFKERLVLGANIQLVSTQPLIIDTSPVVGYKIDKRFSIDVGVTYRVRLTEYPKNSTGTPRNAKDELTYGYRAFSEYIFWKGFYVHGEYERISKEFEVKSATNTPTDLFQRKWVEAALLGVGKSYNINGKVKGSISLLYNFIYNIEEQVYPSPWVFRFGFNFK